MEELHWVRKNQGGFHADPENHFVGDACRKHLFAFVGIAAAANIRGFMCSGYEPFWSLRISGGYAKYHRAGFSPVTRPITSTTNAAGTWTFTTTHPLTAVLTPLTTPICAEDPSGGAVHYTHNVTVTIGSETLRGCCR